MLLGALSGAVLMTLLLGALFYRRFFPPIPTLVPTLPGLPTPMIATTQAPSTPTYTLAPIVTNAIETPPEPGADVATTNAPVAASRIIAVGDSVMLGAALELEKRLGSMDIDARVGRQPSAAIDILRSYYAADQLSPIVIVHVGNNGPFSADQIDEIMRLLADVSHVVFVNVKVPRLWEGPNNAILAQKVRQYPNAVLVDWYAASHDRPELLYDDGVHLRPEGARAYAALIATILQSP
jgi:hypothetical protein